MVCYDLDKFRDHMLPENKDLMFLICHMISRGHIYKRLSMLL